MNKPKITRIILAEGATVTFPQPIGSKSSIDIRANKGVTLEWHPRGVQVWYPGMIDDVVIPDAQLKSIHQVHEETTSESVQTTEKRGPGRPPKEAAQH